MNFITKYLRPKRKHVTNLVDIKENSNFVNINNECTIVGDYEEKIDRISQLPEEILHRILSLLTTKDATRTNVLSKLWNSLWDKFTCEGVNLLLPSTMHWPVPTRFQGSILDKSILLVGYSLDFLDLPDVDVARRFYQKLCLVNVVVTDDKLLEYVISQYTCLECLELDFCNGLKLGGCHWRHGMPIMPTITTLKKLYLEIPNMTDHWFQSQIMSKLPFLEKLKLIRCYMLERIEISSQTLRDLSMIECHYLKEAKIVTPSLGNFEFSGHNVVSFSSMDFVNCWGPINVKIQLCAKDHLDALWLLKLFAVVKKFNRANYTKVKKDLETEDLSKDLSLHVWGEPWVVASPKELTGNFLPGLRALGSSTLEIKVKQTIYQKLVHCSRLNSLLWIWSHSISHIKAPKFHNLYEEYLFWEKARQEKVYYRSCCNSPHPKCKQKYLKHLYKD